MAVVTIDSGAIVGASSGATGWSAKGTFPLNRIVASQVAGANVFQAVGAAAANTRVQQSFTPSTTGFLHSFLIALKSQGNPSDNWYIELCADSAGNPGSVLATSASFVGTEIASFDWNLYEFVFPTPGAITNGTKVHAVLRRSGAVDAANYVNIAASTANPYASHGLGLFDGSTWGAEGTDDAFFVAKEVAVDWYQVTQDTKLHVWKSTDGAASWSEIDSANAPTVNSATKPFSAAHCHHLNQLSKANQNWIATAYFSNTNTVRVRVFDVTTQAWAAGDLEAADFTTDADFNRGIKLSLGMWDRTLWFTSLADDADLYFVRSGAGSIEAADTVLAATHADASCFVDALQGQYSYQYGFHHDISGGDFTYASQRFGTGAAAVDLDATAAATEAEHVSGSYTQFLTSNKQHAIVVYIDADGTLNEVVVTMDGSSGTATLGTAHQVSALTTYGGRHVASCRWGSDYYIFVDTATGIRVYKDTGAAGTWSYIDNWKTGLTNCALSQIVPYSSTGILAVYTDNGDTKCDWWTAVVSAPTTTNRSRYSAFQLRPRTG